MVRHRFLEGFVVWMVSCGIVGGATVGIIVGFALDTRPVWATVAGVIVGALVATPLCAVGAIVGLLASIDERLSRD